MMKFGTCTDRAGIKLGSNGKLRNTMGITMEVGDTAGMEVAEMLMP
jgi:hypothetical protein